MWKKINEYLFAKKYNFIRNLLIKFLSIYINFSFYSGSQQSDTEPPSISNCPDQVDVQLTQGATSAPASWTIPTATDNSGVAPLSSSNYNPGDIFPVGTTLVQYTFSDPSGNSAICSFEVIVRQSGIILPSDITPPVISNCPSDLNIQAAQGASSAVANWNSPTAVDDSGISPSRTSNYSPGQSFPIGTTLVRYTFRDQSGNSAICSFEITVHQSSFDITPPVISNCPTGINLQVEQGANSAIANWNSPTAVDDSGISPSRTSNYSPGQSFPIGTTLVQYTFSDQSGNSAICSFEVIVRQSGVIPPSDVTPPVISNCPDDISVTATTGFTLVEWTEPTAMDETEVKVETKYASPRIFIGFDQAPILVSYTFSDAIGNEAICEFTISVASKFASKFKEINF